MNLQQIVNDGAAEQSDKLADMGGKRALEKSWYKVDETDIPIQSDNPGRMIVPLSKLSSVIAGLKPIRKRMAYCSPEDKEYTQRIVAQKEGRTR